MGTLRQLKARGWWKELPPRGRSGAPLIPRIAMECWVLDLFPPVPDGAEPVAHRETLSSDPCVSWCECVALTRHLVKLQASCDANANHRGRGVMNAMVVVEMKKWARKYRKYRSHLAWSATRSRLSKRTTSPTSLSQGETTTWSATSVACICHRSGHSAAATWCGPMSCGCRHGERHDESRGAGRAQDGPPLLAAVT